MDKKIAIYPGTFDPFTLGHLDVLQRAARIFDKVIISVSENFSKKTLFSLEERTELIKKAAGKTKNIEVDSFKGLLVKYAEMKKASAVIRGLRAVSDFEYEFQMALTNRKMSSKVETVFFMPNEKYSFISSTLVKEIASLGGDFRSFVPNVVWQQLKKKYGSFHK